MNTHARNANRRTTALVLAILLGLGALSGAPVARAAETFTVDNAEFRWGLNKQSAGPSHGPGHNFFSAGDLLEVPGNITAATWMQKSGDVSVEKRLSPSSTTKPAFADTLTDQAGRSFAASSTKYSGLEMVFGKGTGTVDPEKGVLEIRWKGTVTVLYYSGLVRMSISDPIMKVTGSTASVTATMDGYETDRDDPGISIPMDSREVVIADIDAGDIDLSDDKGFSVTPKYLGVTYTAKGADNAQDRSGDSWGAFPSEFIDFASDAGGASFWYSSGTSDASKPALPITVSFDAADPAEVADPGSSTGSEGILGQVIDDTIEDILRAAGTDVADTAAAWMDEAWKPVQPDAVKAAQAAPSGAGTATAPDASIGGDVVVDEEFSLQYEKYYGAGTPMTAGTVGAAAASAPSTSSGGSSANGSPAAPAPVPVTDQATTPVAADMPLSEVVYSQTSASREAGNPTHQWQWWVGAALLALAAVLFYQTVRRKD